MEHNGGWDEIRRRLAELDSERLAEELVEIARRSPKAADRVERLISNRGENLLRFRSKLRRLLASPDRFVFRRAAVDLAHRLSGVLADLRMAAPEPEDGIELVAEFFGADVAVLESCDDSDGSVSDVFRLEADYLRRLDADAARIDDWRNVPRHEAYKAALRRNHGRKWKFWKLYEAG